MLNIANRREATRKLKEAAAIHDRTTTEVQASSIKLFDQRQRLSSGVMEVVETYVNTLANSPKEFDKRVREFHVSMDRFEETVQALQVEAERAAAVTGGGGLAGAAAGVGVAAFAPTAVMAVATTFGTASTGTAISTLSGAAATNAALAWLGGGALAAGGGGIAGGTALLTLAGPVGWTICGGAILGSAVLYNYKLGVNARETTRERIRIEARTKSLLTADEEIRSLEAATRKHADGTKGQLDWLCAHAPKDYAEFTPEQKQYLGAMLNNIQSLGALLHKRVAI